MILEPYSHFLFTLTSVNILLASVSFGKAFHTFASKLFGLLTLKGPCLHSTHINRQPLELSIAYNCSTSEIFNSNSS